MPYCYGSITTAHVKAITWWKTGCCVTTKW